MGKLKETLNQQGFSFSEQDKIERKNAIYRKIADLKATQEKIATYVKLFNPSNVEELREEYRRINTEIKEMQ